MHDWVRGMLTQREEIQTYICIYWAALRQLCVKSSQAFFLEDPWSILWC